MPIVFDTAQAEAGGGVGHVTVVDPNNPGVLLTVEPRILRCINHLYGPPELKAQHDEAIRLERLEQLDPRDATTMRAALTWVGLPYVRAPGEGLAPEQTRQMMLARAHEEQRTGQPFWGAPLPSGHPPLPVRCYACSVCGYVEMYFARVTDPAIWGPPRSV